VTGSHGLWARLERQGFEKEEEVEMGASRGLPYPIS